jgi:hypothetical protein
VSPPGRCGEPRGLESTHVVIRSHFAPTSAAAARGCRSGRAQDRLMNITKGGTEVGLAFDGVRKKRSAARGPRGPTETCSRCAEAEIGPMRVILRPDEALERSILDGRSRRSARHD